MEGYNFTMSPVYIFWGASNAIMRRASMVLNMSGIIYGHLSMVGEISGRRMSEHSTVTELV